MGPCNSFFPSLVDSPFSKNELYTTTMDMLPPNLSGSSPPFPPNLPHDRRTWMPAYAIPLQVLTTILLGIRMLSRFSRSSGRLGLDDGFLIIGWVLSTAAGSLVIVG
jgi:hypothetical protein